MLEVTLLCGQMCIGKQGENLARIVYFPEIEQWKNTFGEGKCELLHQRNGDEAPYPVVLDVEDGKVCWKITNADTAVVGDGNCELHYLVDGVVVKSKTWTTTVLPSLGEDIAEPPEPQKAWVDQVLDAADKVEDATTHQPIIGENKNWFVWSADTQSYVDTGVCAVGENGKDGVDGKDAESGIANAEGVDSFVQVIKTSTSANATYDMTDGGVSGWKATSDNASVIDAGLDVEFTEGKTVFEMDVEFPDSADDVVVYVDAIRYTNAADAARTTLYLNDVAVGDVNLTYIAGSTVTRIVAGSISVLCGTNKLKFVCNNYDGTAKKLSIADIVIRGKQSVAKGYYNVALGRYNELTKDAHHSMAVNYNNEISNKYSFASGCGNTIEGHTCTATGSNNSILGENTGMVSVSGSGNIINAGSSFSDVSGKDNVVLENSMVAKVSGAENIVCGNYPSAEGRKNNVSGNYSHGEGYDNIASGVYSHVGGTGSEASGAGSFAHGTDVKATGANSVAINDRVVASGKAAVAGGQESESQGWVSFAMGYKPIAKGDFSQAFGNRTIASANGQMALGVLNEEDTNALLIVGNGTSDTNRKNLFTVNKDNSITIGKTKITEAQLIKLLSLLG